LIANQFFSRLFEFIEHRQLYGDVGSGRGTRTVERRARFGVHTLIDDAGLTARRHMLDLRVLELGDISVCDFRPYGCCVNSEVPGMEQFQFNVANLPPFGQGQDHASLDPNFPQAREFRVVCSPHSR
jgi:hypothetical protein